MTSEQKEREAVIREATGLSLSSYIFLLISVVRSFFVAWFLGPAAYGIWAVFKTFLETGNLTALGTSQAVARELPYNKAQGNERKNQLLTRSSIGLCTAVATLLSLAALGFSCLDGSVEYRTEIRICALAFILNALHSYIPHQLKGEKKLVLLAIYYLAYVVLNCVIGLSLMICWGISGLLAGMVLTNGVLIAWLLARGHVSSRPLLRWDVSRGLIAIGFPLLLVSFAPKLMSSLNKLIIFCLFDNAATGYYSVASFFSETINYIPLILATVLLPRLMYQKGKGVDLKRVGYLYDKPLLLLACLIPVLLGLLVINVDIAIRYLLPDYLPAVPILQIMITGLFFNVIWTVPRGLLEVLDKQRIFLSAIPLFLLLGSAMSVTAVVLGYGILGVACASVTFYFLVSLSSHIYALKLLQKNRRQLIETLVGMHLPFVYGVAGLLLVQRFVHADNELTQTVLRSAGYLIFCLPLVLHADRKLQLFSSVRVALFKPA